jgi:hypothetical protein
MPATFFQRNRYLTDLGLFGSIQRRNCTNLVFIAVHPVLLVTIVDGDVAGNIAGEVRASSLKTERLASPDADRCHACLVSFFRKARRAILIALILAGHW